MLSSPRDVISMWRTGWTNGLLLALGALFWPAGHAVAQHVIFVDREANGLETGMSWTSAYSDLQDALDEARLLAATMPVEVWVAGGTYHPDRGMLDVSLSFELASNVGIYGGFAGGESQRDDRDWENNETILSGDLLGDDDPSIVIDNPCCWAEEPSQCDDEACVDAVCSLMPGCDVAFEAASPPICGDICRPTFTDNSYMVITASYTDSTAVLDGFTIVGAEGFNGPTPEAWSHGAMYIVGGDAAIRNCVFHGHRATLSGMGVVAASEGHAVEFVNCHFIGGGSMPPFDNCDTGMLRISNMVDVTFDNCDFQDMDGHSILSRTSGSITLRNCRFTGHRGTYSRSAISAADGLLVMKDCLFDQNDVGIYISSGERLYMANCVFRANHAPGNLVDGFMAGATAENCLFVGNQSGGCVVAGPDYMRLLNCTLVHNRMLSAGSAISAPEQILDNTILWGNNSFVYPNEGEWNQFDAWPSSPPEISHCLIDGWTGDFGGEGNSGTDPMFVHPGYWDDAGTPDDWTDDVYIEGDYHLLPGSPAINAGDPSINWHPWAADLDGHPQELCGEADIGAYEFGIGDADCDQVVTLYDFSFWESCLTGPPQDDDPWDTEPVLSNACKALDFNADNHVDLSDFARCAQ